jgi:hypothetical protein
MCRHWSVVIFFYTAQLPGELPEATVVVPSRRTIVGQGRSTQLNCSIDGTASLLEWRRNDVAINEGPHYAVSGSVLNVTDFSEDTVGNYTCIIQTGAWTLSSTTIALELAGTCYTSIVSLTNSGPSK